MLTDSLHNAGFFPIRWAAAESGVTYVRPATHGVLRVVIAPGCDEMALYAGRLSAGELRYRGPVPPATELWQWLCGDFGQLPPRPLAAPAAAAGGDYSAGTGLFS